MKTRIHTETSEQLRTVLVNAGIPVEEYGSADAKTVEQLFGEIESGESQLFLLEDRSLSRIVNVVDVLVRYEGYYLSEAKQILANGEVRVRFHGRIQSVAEKCLPDESFEDAARRAMSEELDISPDGYGLFPYHPRDNHRSRISSVYPGLASEYRIRGFEAILAETVYNPEGYREVQADKTNFFEWRIWEGNDGKPSDVLDTDGIASHD